MRVSIGIPFYNNERTLADAIRSVFAQTFQDWELILVDDGSSDNSLAIAQAVKDERVGVISDGLNRKLACRLNQIARLARGEYIARMDADDLMHPERLERQIGYLDTNPTMSIVGTATYTIDAVNNPLGIRWGKVLYTSSQAALTRGLMIHPTITGRTDWFLRHPYDETFPRLQDRELWCRTYQQNVFGHLEEPLHFYREGTVNLNAYLQSCQMERRIFKKYGPALRGHWRTIFLVIRTYLKGEIYRAFTALGLQSVLIRMRNSPLSESELERAAKVLAIVLKTPVPGLPAKQSS